MLMRFDPFREIDRLRSQLPSGARHAPMSFPMDAIRRGDELRIYLDLPGVQADTIEVTVDRNVLTVRAERFYERREGDEVLVTERPQGEFSRQLMLGENLDTGRLEASYHEGVLELRIPVAETARPRRVPIAAGGRPETIEGTAGRGGAELRGEDLSKGPTPETRHPGGGVDDVRDTTEGPTPETRAADRSTEGPDAHAAGQPDADRATRGKVGGDQV